MAGMRISVSGQQGLKAALEQARESVTRELGAAVQAEADEIVRDARSHVRRDSHDLARSITAQVNGLAAEIRPRSSASDEDPRDHAIKANVNEFGRSSDPGQPYMVPAAETSRNRWPKRAGDAIQRGVKG